ncbi:twin-arginine translocation signal domain-containing protein, partial [Klebsiella pneumoniae]|nr:twin-arginine translocation signal domain-containing protein [Klebsiella pneumoniae]
AIRKPVPGPAATLNRRDFIKTAGAAASAAAVTAAVLGETGLAFAQAPAKKVTLAFVGCAHIHVPGFISLLNKRPDVKVKYCWDHDAAR